MGKRSCKVIDATITTLLLSSSNSDACFTDVRLRHPTHSGQFDIPKDSVLSLRCFVNPALVPLYARAGPNLEFHTTDVTTSQWLKAKLLRNMWLDDEDLEKFQLLQCPVGLLINVDNSSQRATSAAKSIVSDLLIYGILSSKASFERLPTPPESSSPDFHESTPFVKRELRIYAAPLSDHLIAKTHALPSPLPTLNDVHTEDAEFVEFLHGSNSPNQKRKRVATLFEVAAQHHRRVRQKGGEAVSQLMANALSQSQSSTQPQTLKIKRESEEPDILALERIASQRGRSLSLGPNSNTSTPLESHTRHSRSNSNRGLAHSASSSSRRATPNPALEASVRREASPGLPFPEETPHLVSSPKDAETIVSENKHLITRTILTCMRLYGYNRSTFRSVSTSKGITAGGINSGQEETDGIRAMTPAPGMEEDEFKTMYHATYRASTFALRKYLKETPVAGETLPPVLKKEKAMTLIDEFLKLFCEEH